MYKQISDIFNLFKTFEITEDSAKWFQREPQKDAIAELLKTKTFEQIEERLEIVKSYNQTPYISSYDKVYDPIALLKNWTKIEDKGKSIVNEKITKPKTIII